MNRDDDDVAMRFDEGSNALKKDDDESDTGAGKREDARTITTRLGAAAAAAARCDETRTPRDALVNNPDILLLLIM
tara:strand:+ start:58 stop:285 length:228 start_codon:yes stop_codon:yes gene_type:complete